MIWEGEDRVSLLGHDGDGSDETSYDVRREDQKDAAECVIDLQPA
jgi:hypothetical protein